MSDFEMPNFDNPSLEVLQKVGEGIESLPEDSVQKPDDYAETLKDDIKNFRWSHRRLRPEEPDTDTTSSEPIFTD